MITCVRYGPNQTPLQRAPYPGELGERLMAHVSQRAWGDWLKQQTMLINENRLSPIDPKTRAFLKTELEKFFFGEGSAPPQGFVPPSG
jgi:Fe-S cluster biosynthesis and repair protein YggX